MNARDSHDRELYISARDRYSIGRTNMTDAAIVTEQEREIIRYRNKIKLLEKELSEKPTREFAFGDVGEIEAQGAKYTFTITEAIIEQRVDCHATITIKGVIHSKVSE